jgi:hypothetical protein
VLEVVDEGRDGAIDHCRVGIGLRCRRRRGHRGLALASQQQRQRGCREKEAGSLAQ